MAYAVGQRTREIGIRIALGARRAVVLGMMLGQGARVTLTGIALGLIAAAATTRWLQALLFGLSTTDSTTFVVTSTIFAGVALVACYIPARRAARVDPTNALRAE
jgi:ABC-type antimicrobial peptide transport system permease subunit